MYVRDRLEIETVMHVYVICILVCMHICIKIKEYKIF
jgi:hypothetical protein